MEGNLLPLVTLILTAILPSTQAVPVRGLVKSPDGSLCKGAEVFLVSPGIPPLRETQVLRTRTDRRGRFRFEAENGDDFFVWAHGSLSNGESFCTRVQRGVRPGQILLLKGQRREPVASLHLLGISAWGKAKDLRLVWNLNGWGDFTQEVPLTESGQVEVPGFFPLLWNQQSFWIRKKGGRTLFAGRIYWERGSDGVLHPLRGPKEGAPTGLRFVCPKPKSLSVMVQSKGSGKPLADAEVSFRFPYCPRIWVAGKTDSRGEAVFEVPEFDGESSLVVWLRKEGFQGGVAYLDREITYMGRASREPSPPGFETNLIFSLDRDLPLDGNVLGLGKEEKGGALVRLDFSIILGKNSQEGMTLAGPTLGTQVDSSWHFSFRHLPPNLSRLRASLFLAPKRWRKLMETKGVEGGPPWGPLMELHSRSVATKMRSLTFDLHKLRMIPFQVRGTDGAPISFPRVSWRTDAQLLRPLVFKGDRLGRGLLRLSAKEGVLSFSQRGKGFFIKKIGPAARGQPWFLPKMEFELQAFSHFISGRVVNEDGDPLNGVRISLGGLEIGSLGSREKSIQEMNGDLLQGISDQKGRFRLPWVPFGKPSTFSLRFSKRRRGISIWLKKAVRDLEVVFPSR